MRLPRNMGLEPEVIASIKRARRRRIAVRAANISTLVSGVLAALIIFLVAVIRESRGSGGPLHYSPASSWLPLITIAAV
ncbi:MAG: hypothetical protein JW738_05225, partial [Actinobacteria bacterium]|nr:hypothetical protein [Actinomycetota bacterium]